MVPEPNAPYNNAESSGMSLLVGLFAVIISAIILYVLVQSDSMIAQGLAVILVSVAVAFLLYLGNHFLKRSVS